MNNARPAPNNTTGSARSLWRNRDFVLLWSGQAVSALGSNVSGLAFLLLVLVLTNSPAQAGFIGAVRTLPFLALTLPAGAWADRWNRKRVLMLCDAGRALSLASIVAALALGYLTLAQLYVTALFEGSLATIFNITSLASIPRVVPKAQLTEATAANYVAGQTASLAGRPLGTWLFSLAQGIPFVVDALSYVGSVVSLWWIGTQFQQERSSQGSQRLLAEVMDGARWMWRQPVLRFQAFAGGGLSFVFASHVLLVTLLAQRQGTPDAVLGLIFTLGSMGGLVGATVARRVQARFSFGQIMAGMFWGLALLWPLYAVAPGAAALGLVMAGVFAVESTGSIANIAYRLALAPDAYQGRVNSLHRLVGFGVGQPLGVALAGVAAQALGAPETVLLFGAVLLALALACTVSPALRGVKRLG